MTAEAFESWLSTPAATRRPLVMGVLNVTPDSFSDGGQYATTERAIAHARAMVEQGADLIDIGGESTRPGSEPVPADEQIARVGPVIAALRGLPVTISVDTTRWSVAEHALDQSAAIVNDVSAGRDDLAMLPGVARRGVPIVLMHMQGEPRTMQASPSYDDVVGEIRAFLLDRAAAAVHAGVARHRVLLDVGIGFGKTMAHNLALLSAYRTVADAGFATVLGVSRKRFLGTITNVAAPEARVFATAAAVAWGVANGAAIARVHDVEAMRQVVQVIDAIRAG